MRSTLSRVVDRGLYRYETKRNEGGDRCWNTDSTHTSTVGRWQTESVFVKACTYSQHLERFSLPGLGNNREREKGKRRIYEQRLPNEIYSTEQQMRSFRESGHRHSARNARGGENHPGRFFSTRWLRTISPFVSCRPWLLFSLLPLSLFQVSVTCLGIISFSFSLLACK